MESELDMVIGLNNVEATLRDDKEQKDVGSSYYTEIKKNKKAGNVSITCDPYFERTSHLFGIVNGIQNAALALIEKGLGHYNLEDIFADRANITQQLYFEMLKQKLEIRDKE